MSFLEDEALQQSPTIQLRQTLKRMPGVIITPIENLKSESTKRIQQRISEKINKSQQLRMEQFNGDNEYLLHNRNKTH